VKILAALALVCNLFGLILVLSWFFTGMSMHGSGFWIPLGGGILVVFSIFALGISKQRLPDEDCNN